MDADGGNRQQLTDAAGEKYWPSWSLDGSQIVYIADQTEWDVWLRDADGSNPRQLTSGNGDDRSPLWRNDGTAIIISANEDGDEDIFAISPQGHRTGYGLGALTDNTVYDEAFAIRPHTGEIVFQSNRNGAYDLYLMDADGGNVRQITDTEDIEVEASWSPDGSTLIYSANPNDQMDLYILDMNSGAVMQITDTPLDELYADWSPDGSQIAYAVINLETDTAEIYVMDAPGTTANLPAVTENPASNEPALVTAAFAEIDMASVMAQIPPRIAASRIEQVGDNGSGLPAFIAYDFEPEEVAPGVFMDMAYGWALDADTAQQSLRWDFRNESDGVTSTVEYIADIPKSFAPSVAAIEFSVPPTQIINDDPIVKWIIDFTKAMDRRIDARAYTMVDLTAFGEVIDLAEQFQQQLEDINLRRRMAACQYAISDTPTEKAICTLTVIAQSPHMFNANVCETFGDVTGSGNNADSIAFRHACRDIFAQYNNFHCNSLADEPDMQATCLHISRTVYSEACTGLTGIDYDMCLYDVAAYTGQVEGCDSIADQDLALDCRASLTDNPALCRQINDPARQSACCAIFEGNAEQYALCMEGVSEDVIDGEPVDDMGDGQGDTQTLDEVLGTEDPPPDNASSAAFGPLPTAPDLNYLRNDAFYADYQCEGYEGTLRFAWNGSHFTIGQPGADGTLELDGAIGVVFQDGQDHDEYAMSTGFFARGINLWLPLDGSVYTLPAVTLDHISFFESFTTLTLRPRQDTWTIMGTSLATTLYQGSYTREYIDDDREGNVFAVGYAHHVLDNHFRSWFDNRTGLLVRGEYAREATTCYEEGDHIELCPIAPYNMSCELVATSLPITE